MATQPWATVPAALTASPQMVISTLFGRYFSVPFPEVLGSPTSGGSQLPLKYFFSFLPERDENAAVPQPHGSCLACVSKARCFLRPLIPNPALTSGTSAACSQATDPRASNREQAGPRQATTVTADLSQVCFTGGGKRAQGRPAPGRVAAPGAGAVSGKDSPLLLSTRLQEREARLTEFVHFINQTIN